MKMNTKCVCIAFLLILSQVSPLLRKHRKKNTIVKQPSSYSTNYLDKLFESLQSNEKRDPQKCALKSFTDIQQEYTFFSNENKNEMIILGKGGFGQVFKVFLKNNTNGQVKGRAMKFMNSITIKENQAYDNKYLILEEIAILNKLRRNNAMFILQLENAYVCGQYFFIVTKLLNGDMQVNNGLIINESKLNDRNPLLFLKKFNKLSEVFLKLAVGIQSMHKLNLIHNDLKFQNILTSSINSVLYEPVIADFGLTVDIGEKQNETDKYLRAGTRGFAAPEKFEITTTKYSYSADIYGLGVMIYRMLCGNLGSKVSDIFTTPPASDQPHTDFEKWNKKVIEQVIKDLAYLEQFEWMKEIVTFIATMLDITPSKRPNIKEVVDVFSKCIEKAEQEIQIYEKKANIIS